MKATIEITEITIEINKDDMWSSLCQASNFQHNGFYLINNHYLMLVLDINSMDGGTSAAWSYVLHKDLDKSALDLFQKQDENEPVIETATQQSGVSEDFVLKLIDKLIDKNSINKL